MEELKKNGLGAGEKASAGKETSAGNELDAMTIEETFAALDDLIDRLENGRGSLEDAFRNYETGMKLIKSCNEKIEKIEKQILVLNGGPAEDKEDVVYF